MQVYSINLHFLMSKVEHLFVPLRAILIYISVNSPSLYPFFLVSLIGLSLFIYLFFLFKSSLCIKDIGFPKQVAISPLLVLFICLFFTLLVILWPSKNFY